MRRIKIFTLAAFLALACNKKETTETKVTAKTRDEHSYAEPEKAVVRHLNLDIDVDFAAETISGKASWDIDNVWKRKRNCI
jgi:leukotriene-A4 hydrolase